MTEIGWIRALSGVRPRSLLAIWGAFALVPLSQGILLGLTWLLPSYGAALEDGFIRVSFFSIFLTPVLLPTAAVITAVTLYREKRAESGARGTWKALAVMWFATLAAMWGWYVVWQAVRSLAIP